MGPKSAWVHASNQFIERSFFSQHNTRTVNLFNAGQVQTATPEQKQSEKG